MIFFQIQRYSGITPGLLENVHTTVGDVQQRLLEIISPDDIIVGHSLDNDMRALKVSLSWEYVFKAFMLLSFSLLYLVLSTHHHVFHAITFFQDSTFLYFVDVSPKLYRYISDLRWSKRHQIQTIFKIFSKTIFEVSSFFCYLPRTCVRYTNFYAKNDNNYKLKESLNVVSWSWNVFICF